MNEQLDSELKFINWISCYCNYYKIEEDFLFLPGEKEYNLIDVLKQDVPEDYQDRIMRTHWPKIIDEVLSHFLDYIEFSGNYFTVDYKGNKKKFKRGDDFLVKREILKFLYSCEVIK